VGTGSRGPPGHRSAHRRGFRPADYTLGATLDELTRALATLVTTCSTQVSGLSAGAVLRDDSGTRDPAARCAEAADHLHQVAQHLDAANQAARQYHSAISHIGVEVPW